MIIRNCIPKVEHDRQLGDIKRTVAHRILLRGVEPGDVDGPAVIAAFKDTTEFAAGSYTGGETPYPFLIRVDGVIDQCAVLEDVTPHAAAWNATGLGVAIVGDFRRHYPSPRQVRSATEFFALTTAAGWPLVAHSTSGDKICPGPMLDLGWIAEQADQHRRSLGIVTRDGAHRALYDLGVAFT